MATRDGTLVRGDNGTITATWTGLLEDDVGQAVHVGNVDGLCVQLSGTKGDDGEITMQGSNGGGVWGTLVDLAGDPIVLTALGQMAVIADRPLLIRPNCTEGEAVVTDFTVIIAGMRK